MRNRRAGQKKSTEKYHERGNDIYRLESNRENRSGRGFGGIGGKLRFDDERRYTARTRAKQRYFLLKTTKNILYVIEKLNENKLILIENEKRTDLFRI